MTSLVPAGAQAAPVSASTPGKAGATLLRPLTLLKTADLDFGTLYVGTGGTAVINAASNAQTTTGGVISAGGAPHGANFIGAASGLSLIYVQAPAGNVTVTRVGGTETMTVSNFTLQNGNLYLATAAGAFAFRVGATLNVAAGQADGVYVGTFNVTATYY